MSHILLGQSASGEEVVSGFYRGVNCTRKRAATMKKTVFKVTYTYAYYILLLGLSLAIGAKCALAQPFFESTWATALGESDNAVTDGGNWDGNGGNGDYVNVKPISGPGLPSELANLNMATVSLNGEDWQIIER